MRRLLLLFVGLVLVAAAAQESPVVTAMALMGEVEARPRETVTLRVRLENTGSTRATFTPSLTPPIGWTLLVPPGEVRLEAGESRVTLFSVLVPADAGARTYVFPLGYRLSPRGPRHEVLFAVRVPRIERVTLSLLDQLDYVTSEAFTVRFVLRNDGNARQAWLLDARSSASLPLVLEPERAVLDPGEHTEVLVHVTVPSDLAASVNHALTLRATHPERPEVHATARSIHELIPRGLPSTQPMHTFPLTARLSLEGGTGGTARLAGPVLRLEGSGPLSDADPGRLSLHLEASMRAPLAVTELRAKYEDSGTSISVGHRTFARSALLGGRAGFGVHAERTWGQGPGPSVTGGAAAYLTEEGPAGQLTIDARTQGGLTAGADLHASSEEFGGSLEIGYRPPVADPSRVELARLEAAYALRSDVAREATGHAGRFRARVRRGPSTLDLRARAASAVFADEARHEANLDLRAALRLNEILRVDPSTPVDLHLHYGYERAWPGVNGGAAVAVGHTVAGTLSTRLGRTRLSVGHTEEVTREGVERAREATSHVQAYLPFGAEASLRQRVSLVRSRPGGAGPRLGYAARGVAATGGAGRLSVNLDLEMFLSRRRLDTATLAARWQGPLSASWSLDAEGALDLLGGTEVASLGATGRKRFANEHELEVGVDLSFRAASAPQVAFSVAYAIPLDVPLGPRTDVGTIAGRIRTARGEPLGGVIVTTGASTAVTDADGAFVLAGVPRGEQLVHVVSSTIAIHSPLLVPDTPASVVVEPGRTLEVDFEVTAGATVVGRLTPVQGDAGAGDRAVLTPGSDVGWWVRGVRVALSDGTRTLRATPDAAGEFRLARIPPGTWTLQLHHPTLPDEYRIEPSERRLQVEAGARVEVSFQVVPITRTIRFQDGGRLGVDEE